VKKEGYSTGRQDTRAPSAIGGPSPNRWGFSFNSGGDGRRVREARLRRQGMGTSANVNGTSTIVSVSR
jgi:hypothetical protein